MEATGLYRQVARRVGSPWGHQIKLGPEGCLAESLKRLNEMPGIKLGYTVYLAVGLVVMSTLAHAEDVAQMISQYRREHGLSAVKTDLELTAIAERQAKAMAASGI